MTENGSPIEYPIVVIGGRALVVKYSLYAQWQLSLAGIDTPDHLKQMAAKDARAIANMMALWTACVAENYAKAKEQAPTAQDWAQMIPEEQWKECCQAVYLTLVKALRPAAPAQAPVAETPAQVPALN